MSSDCGRRPENLTGTWRRTFKPGDDPLHPLCRPCDVRLFKNISNNELIAVLKSPVPRARGGGPVSTCLRHRPANRNSLAPLPASCHCSPRCHQAQAPPRIWERWDVKSAHFLFDQLRPQLCVCVRVCVCACVRVCGERGSTLMRSSTVMVFLCVIEDKFFLIRH